MTRDTQKAQRWDDRCTGADTSQARQAPSAHRSGQPAHQHHDRSGDEQTAARSQQRYHSDRKHAADQRAKSWLWLRNQRFDEQQRQSGNRAAVKCHARMAFDETKHRVPR